MGRLLSSLHQIVLPAVVMSLMASPVTAEVCDKVLGAEALDRLTHAPLWAYVLHELVSLYSLVGLGIAAVALAAPSLGRWPALLAGLAMAALGIVFVQDILVSPQVLDAAQTEGCSGAYLASAIVAFIVAVTLLGAFGFSLRHKPKQSG